MKLFDVCHAYSKLISSIIFQTTAWLANSLKSAIRYQCYTHSAQRDAIKSICCATSCCDSAGIADCARWTNCSSLLNIMTREWGLDAGACFLRSASVVLIKRGRDFSHSIACPSEFNSCKLIALTLIQTAYNTNKCTNTTAIHFALMLDGKPREFILWMAF